MVERTGYFDNIVKGRIAETIVEELFKKSGYKVFRYGYESVLQNLTQSGVRLKKDNINQTIRVTPDFIVIKEGVADYVASVSEIEHHPFWSFTLKGDKLTPFLKTKKQYHLRQELPKVYALNGLLEIAKRDVIMKEDKCLGNDTRALIIEHERSLDIHTEFDLKLAELIIRNKLI